MSLTFVIIAILAIVRLWIGGQLIVTGRKFQLKNLYWLAAWSITVAGYVIFAPTTPPTALSIPIIYFVGTLIGQFFLIMFMHTTFYQGRQSPVGVFLSVLTAAALGVFYFISINDTNTAGLVAQATAIVNWLWHLVLAWMAYKAIIKDPSVESWVKGRYLLMVSFSLVIFTGNLLVMPLSTPLAEQLPPFVTQLVAAINLLGAILLFLVWVMPEPFRLWLNRQNFGIATVESQPDTRAIFKVIADAMASGTSLNTLACMYAMRQVIGKIIGSDDAGVVDGFISRMTYQDWQQVLNHPELGLVLSRFVDTNAANKMLANARQTLVEKQSLMTLAAK